MRRWILAGVSFSLMLGLWAADKDVNPDAEEYKYNSSDYADYDNASLPDPDQEIFQVVVDPLHRTLLSAEIRSPVTKIYKRMGDPFKKDEVLIQLDDTVHQGNLMKAQAVLGKAEADLQAKQQLFKDNVASQSELKEAEANVAIARSDLITAKRDLQATTIKAPYDGKVVQLKIEEFELPTQGEDIIEVVNDKTLLAKMLIPSSMLKNISVGQPFTIKINETGESIPAKVSRIGSVIDPSSATVRIEGEVDNSNDHLRAGMTGTADFKQSSNMEGPKPEAKDEQPKKEEGEGSSYFPFFSSPDNTKK